MRLCGTRRTWAFRYLSQMGITLRRTAHRMERPMSIFRPQAPGRSDAAAPKSKRGATPLKEKSSGTTATNGWGTGGGVSDYFDVPAFQAKTSLPPSVNDGRLFDRRGVPDVAANASGQSPYRIAPWMASRARLPARARSRPFRAALTARLNQAQGFALGFFLPTLYSGPGLRGITIGNNKPLRSALGYDAGAGWNACTGLGVPTSATGAFLVRLVSASSNLAAVNYGGDKNISKAAPRLYYQDTHMAGYSW